MDHVRSRFTVSRFFLYCLVLALSVIFIFPAVWTFTNSLQPIGSLPSILPKAFEWKNYILAVTMVPYLHYAMNSVIISVISVVLTTISSGLVGYAFARMWAPGKSFLFLFILSTMMLPAIVTQVPTYILFSNIGLTNSFLPWILWGIGGNPFFIFLYRQFFAAIPRDLEDAARIDGCSTFGIYWRIFIPLSLPIMATVVIMSFQGAWGDYMTPFMFLSEDHYPIATALINQSYTMPENPSVPLTPVMNAATVLFVVPILITFFAGQKYLIEGIITSGVKG